MSIYRILTAITKEQVQTQLEKRLKDKPEQIEHVLNADPSPNKAYSIWISKLLQAGNIRLPEDAQKIIETITEFEALKKRNKIKGVDVNRLQTYQELVQAVEKATGEKTRGEEYRESLTGGQRVIFEDATYRIVEITSVEASQKLCRGTKWCVAAPDMAARYLAQGPLFLIYKQNKPWVLLHEETGQVMDIYDRTIDGDEAKEVAGLIPHTPIRKFIDNMREIFRDADKAAIEQMLDQPEIYYHLLWTMGQISNGLLLRYAKSDGRAADVTRSIIKEIVEDGYDGAPSLTEFEPYIAQDPQASYLYASDIIHDRFPAGEPAIALSSEFSLNYAVYVLGGPFPAGEAAMAQNSGHAYLYAIEALHDRFPAGEQAIIKRPDQAYSYAMNILKQRWPEGEKGILKHAFSEGFRNLSQYQHGYQALSNISANTALNYADYMIKGRWPELEKIITETQYGYAAARYAVRILNSPWPEMERAMMSDPITFFEYIKMFPDRLTKEGHEAITNSANAGLIATYGNWALAQKSLMEKVLAFSEANNIKTADVEVAEFSDKIILSAGNKLQINKK